MRERDKLHANLMTHITPAANDVSKFSVANTSANNNQMTAISSDQNHQAVEVADLKAKLRKLRQDL